MDIPAILDAIRPGAAWAMLGPSGDYAALDWRDATQAKPTEAELTAAWPEIEAGLEPVARGRRLAKGLLSQDDIMPRLVRAVVQMVYQRTVTEANKINELVAKAPSNWNVQPISVPTKQQVIQTLLNAIDSGDAD